jgi:hypothetical protein
MAYSGDIYGLYGSTEISLKRVLPGNSESVRKRLAVALERLGYDVIEEEPTLLARRGAKGWGTWGSSADVLDYAMTLTIRLKPTGANSTRATFDYNIKHPWLSQGDKEILTREAEAITALASVRAADNICGACGTASMGDSRFCRRCGAPMSSDQTELDILRVSAEARAGHTSVASSAFLAGITTLLTIITLVILGTGAGGANMLKILTAISVLSGGVGLLNLLATRFAWKRLNNALRLKDEERRAPPIGTTPEIPRLEADVSPQELAGMSVTEGTTRSFGEPVRHSEKRYETPVVRDDLKTGEFN